MKKIFLALMAVAAIAMAGTFAGCENRTNEPEQELEAPENFTVWSGIQENTNNSPDTTYAVDNKGGSNGFNEHQHL
ncbi:MAG: hypothetical protein MJZ75_07120 [Paludibacteraceae bacterium]|nr:hypothetical protein [Paludibacteraceae bacterium]